MNKALIFLLLLGSGFYGCGQDLSVSMDYKVVYEIPAPMRNSADTISISFDTEGKYLYSDAKLLGDDLGRSVFKNPNTDLSPAESSFVLDTKNMEVYFDYSLNRNSIFFKMDIESLIPADEDPFEGNVEIIMEKTEYDVEIAGSSYPSFLLYPDNEPEEPLTLAIDTSRPVDNSIVLNAFIQLMLRKTDSKGSMSINIPKGLILGIYTANSIMMEAISVENVATTINISHQFTINE
ncbi:MAG: hypothetical protein KJO05_08690 [Bacteroidia bacterium]|nr:hypothetical protein [Bacteroidia bacterium]NNF31930.1 hypothetical protein [Flavobacteriaceae bacterium]MBT8275357.1 hypothetical protein [Bacteroidia bacterium]NNJ81699.1 hypothetical protein [Flavobacteriaceae bacterium]NNK53618.1 hypothetical protein [Flavobacteriaceae bacterium]